ncbi:coiled-coil domain-containing protein 42 homolog isoform X1 [Perca fluviatilis]|uniref:coiled-coil domain-containing protein 42 homolog isoform X1 n=1 Tax=Perca fluviatilis TaxID=8168 RepID=UPI0019651FC7|nr:coiled-coil domain-containing protein 42 homolog isoform X1 [Perca fluviatilis]
MSVREQLVSQCVNRRSPAGASHVIGGPLRDRSFALFDLQKKRREDEDLDAKQKECKQILERLQQRIHKLHEEAKKVKELHLSFDKFLKDEDADQAAEKAERERKEVLQLEAELERLKVEYAVLIERKQELQRQVQRHSSYWDFMERVVKMTKFDKVQALTGHLESLLHFRDHLYQRESKAQEQVSQQRKALLTLEDQHHFLRLHKNNQLSQLQTELEKTRSEALTWERKWTHIQETAAKKTLLLGQIKMATLNLYEMTDDILEEEEAVDMNDTEKQLDKVKMFIQDYEDIVKQHQTSSQRHEGQKKEKAKKLNTVIQHCKKLH